MRILAVSTALVALGLLALWLWTPDLSRTTLLAQYGTSTDQFTELAGLRLHWRETGPDKEAGQVPTLLLLHGFGSSLQTWEAWADVLSKEYRVIRIDLPGAGLTGPDPTGDYSDERALQILDALLAHCAVEHVVVIGNSLGGRIAWEYAASRPERVDKLVLISPDGFASPGFEYEKPPEVPGFLKLMQFVLPKALFRMNLEPAFAHPESISEALVQRYYDMMRAPGVRAALIARMQQTLLHDPHGRLARIKAPTLLLWGEKDQMIPHTNAKDYLEAIPHSTLVTLLDVGHVPQEEAPTRTLAPLEAFLRAPGVASSSSSGTLR